MSSIRLALVGCGEVTDEKHLPALRRLGDVSVVALADADAGRLDRVADRFAVPARFPDVHALLEAVPDLDAVGVCVPPAVHAEVAVPALRAGKAVLIEKPLAASLAHCDLLMDEARRASAVAMVGFHMRWHRLVRRARAVIDSGALGRLEAIRAIWYSPRSDTGLPDWKRHRELGGGALVEIGVHHFDLWRHLLATEVSEVYALSRHGARDDEAVVVAGRLANGMLASAALSERASHEIEIEVSGDAGRLRIGCQRFDGLDLYATDETSGMLGPRIRKAADTAARLPGGLARMRRGGDYADSYRAQWRHFVDCARTGRPPASTLEDGRRALQVVLAAAESARRGQPVRVEEAPASIAPPEAAAPRGPAGTRP
jgi:predicted dehydrogenase